MPRKLGQHFLKDLSVANFIVDSAQILPHETVLEVGPGLGILTRLLAKKARKVIAVEKDTKLEESLIDLPANVKIVWGDILRIKFPPADKIVSNLPFYISSKFIFTLPPVPAVLGLQKEFAEKMVASPGTKEYGRLSVNSQIKFTPELLRSFPPEVFTPAPKVWLSVVRLTPHRFEDWKRCGEFIRKIFSYPNRKVDTALKLAGFRPAGIEKRVRELSPEEVVKLQRMMVQNS